MPKKPAASSYHGSFSQQFEENLGLREWKSWFFRSVIIGALVFVGYVYEGDLLFGISLLDLGIYGAIILTALMALRKNYEDAKFIDSQTHKADRQVDQLIELHEIREFLRQAEDSIFKQHIENLWRILKNHSDLDQSTLIEILHSRLMARNRNVELLSGVLITLGLVGTIIGLILMTDDLSAVMSSVGTTETPELMQKIAGNDGPLGSLGIAFYTTLLGAVLGGVVLRILSSINEASITRYTAHVAELTEVHVLPAMRKYARSLEKAGYYERTES